MQDSSTALSPVLQFRQDLQAKLRDGVRRAIETVLEEELLTALGAETHERTSGRRGYRHGTIDRTVTTREGTRTITVPRGRLHDQAEPSTEFQSTVLPRYARRTREVDDAPRLASSMHAIELRQQPAPLLIGERVNAQGSRAIKRLLLADDYDGILGIARTQVEGGAHALDLCVAVTERSDEAEQMRTVVKTLQMSIDAPLVIDSTDADVIKAALEVYPGRGIVNSVNLENGRARCDAVLPSVRDHGACVIALTIDEQGMARTADRKLEIARRIHDLARDEFGLAPDQLIFDALTFTLATGEAEWIDSARETIDGIRTIKRELPGVLTVLGVSNVSFGMPARRLISDVFLDLCVQAGQDSEAGNANHQRVAIIQRGHAPPSGQASGACMSQKKTRHAKQKKGRRIEERGPEQ